MHTSFHFMLFFQPIFIVFPCYSQRFLTTWDNAGASLNKDKELTIYSYTERPGRMNSSTERFIPGENGSSANRETVNAIDIADC